MKQVEPQVFLLARPAINEEGLAAYLRAVGASSWGTDAPSGAEKLVEVAGRSCYRSFEPGLNPKRLARKICNSCKEEITVPRQALVDVGFAPDEAKGLSCYQGKGCMECNDLGYRGRVAPYEAMAMTEDIKDGILQGAS